MSKGVQKPRGGDGGEVGFAAGESWEDRHSTDRLQDKMWIVKGGRGKEGELGVQQTARRWVNGNAEGSSFKYEMLCFVVPTRGGCVSLFPLE